MLLSFTEPNAIDDAGMVELIAEHCVLWCEYGLEQPSVGIKATGVENIASSLLWN